MALLRKTQLNQLDLAVTNLTQGQPFISWAESIAQRLVDNSSNKKSIVNIKRILSAQNIILREVNESQSNSTQMNLFDYIKPDVFCSHNKIDSIHKAHLVNKKDHYDLFIDLARIESESLRRFILAHEIAHTLFYSSKAEGLEKKIALSFGSKQIENICDFIAICILLPKSFIEEEIRHYKAEKDTLRKRNENYLKFVFHIAAKYQVDWYFVFYRLISNFDFLPNSLCLEFFKQDKWYIRLVFQTDSLTAKKLYIPRESKSESRFVSAKKSFTDILNTIEEESALRHNYYSNLIVDKSHFDSYYQGNFKQFLSKYFTHELNIIKIYYRVNNDKSILGLFPFDGLIKN